MRSLHSYPQYEREEKYKEVEMQVRRTPQVDNVFLVFLHQRYRDF